MTISFFFFIPYIELTQGMINKSTSNNISEIPIRYIGNTPFYLLEVLENNFKTTDIFNAYRPYNQKEIDTATPETPGQKLTFEGVSDLSGSISIGQRKSFTYTVLENKILKGIVLGVNSSNFLDYIDIEIYSGETLVTKKVNNLYVVDGRTEIIPPPSLIIAGLTIKLTYSNTGVLASKIFVNLVWSKQ